MKKIGALFIWIILFLFASKSAHAIFDPLRVVNNKFGMHIIDESDLNDVARLVNSSGGDWGYVKLVITQDDRKRDKWQEIFNRMRELHLIPIIRLATKVENGKWIKPRVDDIGSWVDFLGSLNWVVENRYVVIFNEPNHAKEWGGELNPEEYAWYLKEFSRLLKEKSPDFFILPAGLDASAPNSHETMDEAEFIKRMVAKEPDVLNFIDGWSSHSYPNPGFSGSPYSQGKGTIQTFVWEKNLLSGLGKQNLPIFILETGWKHSDGKHFIPSFLSPQEAAQRYQYAFTSVWQQSDVVAVVPFLLNYQDEPFDHFSWKKYGSNDFNAIFNSIQTLPKIIGKPKQLHSAYFREAILTQKMITNSDYSIFLRLENTGQSLLSSEDDWRIEVEGLPETFIIEPQKIDRTKPFYRTKVEIKFKTPAETGKYAYRLKLFKDNTLISESESELILVPPPSLLIDAKVWFQKLAKGNDFALLIYDLDEKLLFEQKQLNFDRGIGEINQINNILLDTEYRVVLTKAYYLPHQTYIKITETKTGVSFPQLLPLDPSNDGKISFEDFGAFLGRPLETIGLLMAL